MKPKVVHYLMVSIICILFLSGCYSKDTIPPVESPVYNGRMLDIGVIGESPEVRESNIRFHSIAFEDLETNTQHIAMRFL